MSTIGEAINTEPRLRSSIEKQQAYVARRWAEPHYCMSCETSHDVWSCAPEGWLDKPEFPDELVCPHTKKPVKLVVPLFPGPCFLWKAEQEENI